MANLKIIRTDVVVIGVFNVHIILPRWLIQIGAAKQGEELSVHLDMASPGLKIESLRDDGLIWTVRSDILAVTSKQQTGEEFVNALKVLRSLPWTPVTAIGVNISFSADNLHSNKSGKSENWNFQNELLRDLGENLGVESSELAVSLVESDGETRNLVLSGDERGKVVTVNFNTVVPQGRNAEERVSIFSKAIGDFKSREKTSRSIATKVFEKL